MHFVHVLSCLTPHVHCSLHDYVVVQRILAMEEREAYGKAMATVGQQHSSGRSKQHQQASPQQQAEQQAGNQTEGDGEAYGLGALSRLHHSSCYQQGLSQMLEAVVAPALTGLKCLLQQQHLAEAQLRTQNQLLQVFTYLQWGCMLPCTSLLTAAC